MLLDPAIDDLGNAPAEPIQSAILASPDIRRKAANLSTAPGTDQATIERRAPPAAAGSGETGAAPKNATE